MSPVELVGVEHTRCSADYLLAHCEGYRVESADGRVGYVEEVVWSPGSKWSPYSDPVALRVQSGSGVVTIPIEDVLELHPRGERLVVGIRAGPLVPAEKRARPPRRRERPLIAAGDSKSTLEPAAR